MSDVVLEVVQCKDDDEEVANFDFKSIPDLFLVSSQGFDLAGVEHGDVRDCSDKLIFTFILFSGLNHRYPLLFLGLLFGSDFKGLHIFSKIGSRVSDYIFSVLE